MLLDGHSAASVAERLGLAGTNLLYRWKREQLERTGPVATSLEARVHELEIEFTPRRAAKRDILKKRWLFSAGKSKRRVRRDQRGLVQEAELPTASVCEVLEVSRSAYYAWRVGEPSQREQLESDVDAVGAGGGVLEASPSLRLAGASRRNWPTWAKCAARARVGKLYENPGFAGGFNLQIVRCPRRPTAGTVWGTVRT